MTQWFRLYESVLDDPKVQRLKPDAFRAWVNMLALASRHDGVLPEVIDIGFALRVSEEKAAEWVSVLYIAGLLDRVEDGTEHTNPRYMPHNWASRQYKSDGSAERMRRHRDRHRNAPSDVTVTPSDTESDTEQNRTEQKEPERATRSGSRLPEDWQPSAEDRAFAGDFDIDVDATASVFRDYWHGVAGAKGRKADWAGTWRNWVRREAAAKKPGARAYPPPNPAVTVVDDGGQWTARLRGWHQSKFWKPELGWGPPPGEAGCLVPPHLLPREAA